MKGNSELNNDKPAHHIPHLEASEGKVVIDHTNDEQIKWFEIFKESLNTN